MIIRVFRQPGVPLSWESPARLWAQQLLQAGVRYRVLVPAVGVRMEIHCWPEHDEARVYLAGGGEGLYQFIGTGPTAYKNYLAATGRYIPKVYAVLVDVAGGTIKAHPLVSSVEAPPASEWTYDADPRNTDEELFCTPAHQWDGNGVRPHYFVDATHDKRNVPWLVTQWQQSHPLNGFGYEGGALGFYTQDVGYDFAPTLFEESAPNTGRTLAPVSDWYQSAAFLSVGGRRFVVMVDADNVFYCYPTSGYTPELQAGQDPLLGQQGNVPALYVKSQAFPFPVDVVLPAIGHGETASASNLRPRWEFAPDGTRAACVVAVRLPVWGDSAAYDNEGTKIRDLKEDAPVLVEAEFEVVITGPNPEDFTFAVSRSLTVDSRTDDFAAMAVGYAVREMKGGAVALGELLALEFRHYTSVFEMARFHHIEDDISLYYPERPNRATVAVVSARRGGVWVEVDRWLAYYGCFPYNLLDVGNIGVREFSPLLEEIPGVPPNEPGETPYWNHFAYAAQHFSIDLSSLSFGIAATLITTGTQPPTSTSTRDRVTYGAEAQLVIIKTFGDERVRRRIGHPSLRAVIDSLHDLEAAHPNISSMTRFSLAATASYAAFTGPAWASPILHATLTVTDGLGTDSTVVVEHAAERVEGWDAIKNCGLFPSATAIYAPQVYSFWDDYPFVRTGMAYQAGSLIGTINFTNYPYGLIHHRTVSFLCLNALNAVQQRINWHRNGSWAVFAGPFAAMPYLHEVTDATGEITSNTSDQFEQIIVDRIVVRKNDKTEFAETTHITEINKAFQKSWAVDDYYFSFRKLSNVATAEMTVHAYDPTLHGWYPVAPMSCPSPAGTSQAMTGTIRTVRVLSYYSADNSFVERKPYNSYSPFTTFPTPCQEGIFPFPGV